jgi:hypothetical protein
MNDFDYNDLDLEPLKNALIVVLIVLIFLTTAYIGSLVLFADT